MGLTVDRHSETPDYDDLVRMADRGIGDPTLSGDFLFSNTAFRFCDGRGVYDGRRPWASFLDGAVSDVATNLYKVVTGTVKPTLVTWFKDVGLTQKLFTKTYTYGGTNVLLPTQIVSVVYNADGSTAYKTCTETISYSGNVFESSRTRVFS
jgi:hypothetical protein